MKKQSEKNKKTKKNNSFALIATILFIILMSVLIYIKVSNETNQETLAEEQRTEIFSAITRTSTACITKFSVYGTHFNLEGTLKTIDLSGINIDNTELIIKSLEGEETTIDTEFTYSGNICYFSSYNEINTGVDLESLTTTEYYILLKVTYSNSDINYYSLENTSDYEDITYYTITKNNTNNKINIAFNTYSDIKYLSLNVEKVKNLPDDVYDIAIDPGHGGLDVGATSTSGDYNEADLVLTSGLYLKEQLEKLGMKVFISRDETLDESTDTAYNMYDDDRKNQYSK